MILKVGIFKEGVVEQLQTAYNPQELDLEFVDLHYLKKVDLEGSAERIRHTVTFRGILESQIEQVCARCLEKIQSPVRAPFELTYDAQGKETIDTTADLRDILLLEHPDRFLCKSGCRGICETCGINLNQESCSCKKTKFQTGKIQIKRKNK